MQTSMGSSSITSSILKFHRSKDQKPETTPSVLMLLPHPFEHFSLLWHLTVASISSTSTIGAARFATTRFAVVGASKGFRWGSDQPSPYQIGEFVDDNAAHWVSASSSASHGGEELGDTTDPARSWSASVLMSSM